MRKISTKLALLTVFIISMLTVFPVSAGTVTKIDFEDMSRGDYIWSHYPGLSFSGSAMIITYSDYIEYPSHSGSNLVDPFNYNPCTISFATPVSRIGLWYTSAYTASIEAYDSSGSLINRVEGPSDLGTTRYLEVTGQDITSVTINTGTFDDLEYETQDTQSTSVPEFPSIILPVTAVLGLMFVFGRRK